MEHVLTPISVLINITLRSKLTSPGKSVSFDAAARKRADAEFVRLKCDDLRFSLL